MAQLFAWGGALGVGIQSAFAWTTYNQGAYLGNVGMRQNQAYQKKNYHISWVAMARDDIRSMMEVSVTRLNNYMIVSTLILGLSCSAVMAVDFKADDPSFLEEMFLVSMGMSVVFLIVAITLAVKGQNAAFTNTMKLLIHEIRPENPAEYNHDYMGQAQVLERDGIKSLFRIPGCMPVYQGTPKEVKRTNEKTESSSLPGKNPCQAALLKLEGAKGAEEYVPISDGFENLEKDFEASQLRYLFEYSRFMRLWSPFDTYCKFAMSLGIIALGHGCTYFALSKVGIFKLYQILGLLCMTAPFLYIPMVIVNDSFKFPTRGYYICGAVMQAVGPLFGIMAIYVRGCASAECDRHGLVQAIMVPLCFFAHGLFYAACFRIAYDRTADARLPSLDRDDDLMQELDRQQKQASESTKDGEDPHWDGRRYASAVREVASPTGFSSLRSIDKVAWPSDAGSFIRQADELSRSVRRSLRRALLVAVCMYAVLTLRAITRLAREIYEIRHLPPPPKMLQLSTEWPVAWHSAPLFKPYSLACGGRNQIFLADEFHVFELVDRHNLRRICSVDRPIRDITTSCKDDVCLPVMLLPSVSDSDGNTQLELHSCEEGRRSSKLLQTLEGDVDHANLYSSRELGDVLVTTHGDELLQNRKSKDSTSYYPEWTMGDVVSKNLRSLSADTDMTILFTAGDVQLRSATSRKLIGRFIVPPEMGNLTAGCRIPGTVRALSLSYTGHSPKAHVLTFPGMDDLVLPNSHRARHNWSRLKKHVEQQLEKNHEKPLGTDGKKNDASEPPRSNSDGRKDTASRTLQASSMLEKQSGQSNRYKKIGRHLIKVKDLARLKAY